MLKNDFWKNLSLGWRSIKTSISVAIIIAVYTIFNLGQASLASLSAVFALRETMEDTYQYAKFRIFGNTVGVLIATSLIFLRDHVEFFDNDLYTTISGGLGVLLVINFCTLFNNTQSIINSVATFLVVYLSTPEDTWIIYSIRRILDTIFGTFVAIVVNKTLPSQNK